MCTDDSPKLLNCPLCGGEAMLIPADDESPAEVYCSCCWCSVIKSGTAGAIATWNARAAVADEQFSTAVHDGRAWQVVRECRNVGEETDDDFKCPLCGESYNESDDMAMPASRIDWCFSCGAKVVG